MKKQVSKKEVARKQIVARVAEKVVEKKAAKREPITDQKEYDRMRAWMEKFSTPAKGSDHKKAGVAFGFRGKCRTEACTCSQKAVTHCYNFWKYIEGKGLTGEKVNQARAIMVEDGKYTPIAKSGAVKKEKVLKEKVVKEVKAKVEDKKSTSAREIAKAALANLTPKKSAALATLCAA